MTGGKQENGAFYLHHFLVNACPENLFPWHEQIFLFQSYGRKVSGMHGLRCLSGTDGSKAIP